MKAEAIDRSILEIGKAEKIFTDREEPRKAFWTLYEGLKQGDIEILNYYGTGGIGKSRLLEKLQEELDDRAGAGNYIYYTFERKKEKKDILYEMSVRMRQKQPKLKFPTFEYAYMKYAEGIGEDIGQMLTDMKKTIFDSNGVNAALNVAGDFLPFMNTISAAIKSGASAAKAVADKYNMEKGKDSGIYQRINESSGAGIEASLQSYFAYDAAQYFAELDKPFVIMLDGYELFVNKLKNGDKALMDDLWLRERGSLIRMIPNVLWVIAGREKLHWAADLILPEQKHLIGQISLQDATDFFKDSGIMETELYEGLHALTKGTPEYMDICIKCYRHLKEINGPSYKPSVDEFGQDTEALMKRYVRDMSASEQDLMHLLSLLPNAWNDELVKETAQHCGYEHSLSRLRLVKELSLVEKLGDGYCKLHATFREVVADNMEKEKKTELLQGILSYMTERIQCADSTEVQLGADIFYVLQTAKENRALVNLCAKQTEILCRALRRLLEFSSVTSDYLTAADTLLELAAEETQKFSAQALKVSVLTAMGECREAERLGETLYNECLQKLGEKHEVTLLALYALATVSMYRPEKWQQAAEWAEQIYEGRIEILGAKVPDTLEAQYLLASICTQLEMFLRTEELLESGCRLCREVFGHGDLLLVKVRRLLMYVYGKLNEHEKKLELTETIYRERMSTGGECGGEEEVVQELMDIAGIYKKLQNDTREKELYEKAYRICREHFDEEHPLTLQAMLGLVTVYNRCATAKEDRLVAMDTWKARKEKAEQQEARQKEQSYKEAENLYEERKRRYGEMNPYTLQAMREIVACSGELTKDNKEKCSRNFADDMVTIHVQVYGEYHEETRQAYRILSGYYRRLGARRNEVLAEQMHHLEENKYKISKVLYGVAHPYTLSDLEDMLRCYRLYRSGRDTMDRRIELYETWYQHTVEKQGEQSEAAILILEEYVDCLTKEKREREAVVPCEKLYNLQKKIFGDTYNGTLKAMRRMSDCYEKIGDIQKAMEWAERCYIQTVQDKKEMLDDLTPSDKTDIKRLRRLYDKADCPEQIFQTMQTAYEKRLEKYGEADCRAFHILRGIADLYRVEEKWEKCIEFHQRCYDIARCLHEDEIGSVLDRFAYSCRLAGDTNRAAMLYEEKYQWHLARSGAESGYVVHVRSLLADAYAAAGNMEKAIEHKEAVYAWQKANGSKKTENTKSELEAYYRIGKLS